MHTQLDLLGIHIDQNIIHGLRFYDAAFNQGQSEFEEAVLWFIG